MSSRFFITRPIFSAVISIVIVIAGLVASQSLPIAQYPAIAPPTVQITASYPGASAETLANTVAAPIEEQLNGIEGLSYFSSTSNSSGAITITATFEVGTDVDTATQNVNNRVKAAEARLPEEVRRNGVSVLKSNTDILLVAALYSPDESRDRLFISNYASLNVVDEIKRINGVGDVVIFGAQDYSMRIWLKPDRMAQLGITTSDIASAIRTQNVQNAGGKIGQEPAPVGQMLTYTVTAKGRLIKPEEFGDIVIRAGGADGMLRIRDVARVELAAYKYNESATANGKPTVALGVFLQTGANALDVAERTRTRLTELKQRYPDGLDYLIPYDTTLFVSASIDAVIMTLIEAALLVVAVVYLFLQSWRATLIPMVAVPVSLIGTFAGLYAFGFTINTLTLFALVLAIGIVVDDAIIVLENVERHMTEEKMPPMQAAITAMQEVSSAVVAIVLVLASVFIPVAFLGGIAGVLYQQFAVTVAVAVIISGIVALTLTPALCAIFLKSKHEESRVFRPFNRGFAALTRLYTGTVSKILHHPWIGIASMLAVMALLVVLFRTVPGSFVPSEDQGLVISALMLPDSASLQRTVASGRELKKMFASLPATENVFVISGRDIIGGGNKPNGGTVFTTFKDWSEREQSAEQMAGQMMGMGMGLSDGMALTFNPPPIRGLGSAGGFEVYVQNRDDGDPMKLHQVMQNLIGALSAREEFSRISTFFRPTSPQLFVEVDEAKAMSLGIPLSSIYETLQSTMGALYVNDFNMRGRAYRVQLQAEARYRMQPEDIGKLYVRSSSSGKMIPLAAVSEVKDIVGPEQLERFNGFVAAKIMGSAVTGISSGESIQIVEEIAAKVLPPGFTLAWAGEAYQQQKDAGTSAPALIFGVIMVFLIRAAQYEKWSLPLAVILSLPIAITGALALVFMRGMPNDIYFQIGLVVLIGLASKNAILIVEFAAQQYANGKSVTEAALEAARLRFRPIVMTSLAFMLGVVPLAFSTGAGAAARQSMGTGVLGGMLAATFVATLFVPLFFKWLERGKQGRPADEKDENK